MENNIRSIEIKNEDLVLILNKMASMCLEEGYIDFIEKGGIYTLTFFETNPKLNGFDALKVTQKKILKHLLK